MAPETPPDAQRVPTDAAGVLPRTTLEAAILALLETRAPAATVCPSEVARQLAPQHWRPLMEPVREAARALARSGRLELRQRGHRLDPDATLRGPIRLARPGPTQT